MFCANSDVILYILKTYHTSHKASDTVMICNPFERGQLVVLVGIYELQSSGITDRITG